MGIRVTGSLAAAWLRRSVSFSVLFLLWFVCTFGFPIGMLFALILDGFQPGRRFPRLRCVLFFMLFLNCEIIGLVLSFGRQGPDMSRPHSPVCPPFQFGRHRAADRAGHRRTRHAVAFYPEKRTPVGSLSGCDRQPFAECLYRSNGKADRKGIGGDSAPGGKYR
jgi:hypothetical protein